MAGAARKVGNPNQQPSYPMARSTPTVDGDLLCALSSDGDLACLETATGKIRWRKSLRGERGLPTSNGGAVLMGDYRYGSSNQGLVAAEFISGKIRWQAATRGRYSDCAWPTAPPAAQNSPRIPGAPTE
ncbi:MAG: PQQ-binding-like beta-propeller repeat protein [Acidobacteria bacterium]|nr:PQQ-binding-like beta-propeller repeat protein [Acidobacteriota bacterium]